MPSTSTLTLIGHAGHDADLTYAGNGIAVCRASVAVNRRLQAGGEWVEETEWYAVVAFGPIAERTAEQVHTGTLVYVEGTPHARAWIGGDGHAHAEIEVVARRVLLLHSRHARDGRRESGAGSENEEMAEALAT